MFGFFSIICLPKFIIGGLTFYIGDFFYLIILLFLFTVIDWKYAKIPYGVYILSVILLLLMFSTLNFLSPLIDKTSLCVSGNVFDSFKYVLKTIPNIVFFILLILSRNIYQCVFCIKYINGFVSAVIFHSIYSIVQIIYLYLFQIDIQSLIFTFFKVTDADLDGHPVINYAFPPIIRTAGFHWDPAYFGLWGGIVLFSIIFIENKYLSKFVFLLVFIAWIQTFSRTAYISAFILLILFYVLRIKTTLFIKNKIFIGMLIVLISIFEYIPNETFEDINSAIFERVDTNSISTIRHINYPKYSLMAILNDPFHFFFGYGARNSSRGLYHVMDGYDNELQIRSLFEIESDFCKMMVNYGFFSLLLYSSFITLILYYLYLLIRKNKSFYVIFCFSSVILSFICGVSYSYNDAKWIWIIYFISIVMLKNRSVQETIEYAVVN